MRNELIGLVSALVFASTIATAGCSSSSSGGGTGGSSSSGGQTGAGTGGISSSGESSSQGGVTSGGSLGSGDATGAGGIPSSGGGSGAGGLTGPGTDGAVDSPITGFGGDTDTAIGGGSSGSGGAGSGGSPGGSGGLAGASTGGMGGAGDLTLCTLRPAAGGCYFSTTQPPPAGTRCCYENYQVGGLCACTANGASCALADCGDCCSRYHSLSPMSCIACTANGASCVNGDCSDCCSGFHSLSPMACIACTAVGQPSVNSDGSDCCAVNGTPGHSVNGVCVDCVKNSDCYCRSSTAQDNPVCGATHTCCTPSSVTGLSGTTSYACYNQSTCSDCCSKSSSKSGTTWICN